MKLISKLFFTALFLYIIIGILWEDGHSQTSAVPAEYRVLPNLPQYKTMVLDFVNREIEYSLRNLPEYRTLGEWIVNRRELRQKLLRAYGLDPLPPRTPLNPKTTGWTEYDDYIMENVIFESRPSFYVTANLYIPKNHTYPMPAVLHAMGHRKEFSKASHYQRKSILLAKNGYVVLAFDPIGQGERVVPGNDHWVGFRAFMIGESNIGFMVWDAMRAIDYLISRPEIDPSRIGCTGFSGGGLQTLYLAPVDERVKAAVPGGYMDSYEAFITSGMHCVCSHIPGAARFARKADIAALVAPRAFVSAAGTFDWHFFIWGTRNSHRRLSHIYNLMGVPDNVRLSEYGGGHGYVPPPNVSPEVQYGEEYQALLAMNRYLYNDPDRQIVVSPDVDLVDPKAPELYCLKNDEFPPGAKSYADILMEKASSLPPVPPPPSSRKEWEEIKNELKKKIDHVLGGVPEVESNVIHSYGIIKEKGYSIEKVYYVSEPRVYIPGLLFVPDHREDRAPAVLYIDDRGKQNAVNNPGVKRLINCGYVVFAPDLRGYGETAGGSSGWSTETYPSVKNYIAATNSIILGRHLTGMRVYDIMQGIAYLVNRHQQEIDPERIACWGVGTAALECLFAAALNPSIKAAALENMILSYKRLITYPGGWNDTPSRKFSNMDPGPFSVSIYLPNVLLHFDTPQAAAMMAPRPLLITNPVEEHNEPVSEKEIEYAYAYTKQIYNITNAEPSAFEHFSLPSKAAQERISQWIVDNLK